jgi:uroporphyrinogen-III decarboxylase
MIPLSDTFFLDLAEKGASFPIGTDLVLRDEPDPEEILLDGSRLAKILIQAAESYRSPIALPVMDLTNEKSDLLTTFFGVGAEEALTWHFTEPPSDDDLDRVRAGGSLTPRMAAVQSALREVAKEGSKVPTGMVIGPFSLMTKLVASPIEPVYMAGSGMTGEDDDEILLVERCLELAMIEVERSVRVQAEAGIQAIFIAEPAANKAYFSPNQILAGSDIFDRLALDFNRRLFAILRELQIKPIFHCCGDLIEPMVKGFCSLGPSILSLGSSRSLPEDAALVPENIVLYGNLPSKRFYSDDLVSVDQAVQMARALKAEMGETGHPFILGTECDVLSVPGCHETIKQKVRAIVEG